MSDTRVTVGSSIYNLAGPASGRLNYLKSLTLGAIMAHPPAIGPIISKGYLQGPGIKIRNFLSWAHRDAEFIDKFGTTTSTILSKPKLDNNVIQGELTGLVTPPQTVHVDSAEIGPADLVYWVVQQIALTHNPIPPYTYVYNYGTGEMTITYLGDLSTETFTVVGFDNTANYLYVRYRPVEHNLFLADFAEDDPVVLDPEDSFPDLSGWTTDEVLTPTVEKVLKIWEETDITYSDARTPLHYNNALVSSETVEVVENHGTYHKDAFQGEGPAPATNSTWSIRSFHTRDLTYTIQATESVIVTTRELEGGVIETTTKTRQQDRLVAARQYQNGTQSFINWCWLDPQYYLYKELSGNTTLDAFFAETAIETSDRLYPMIPLRYENVSLTSKSRHWYVDLPFAWGADPAEGDKQIDYDKLADDEGIYGDQLWIARSLSRIGTAIRLNDISETGDGQTIYTYKVTAADPTDLLEPTLKNVTPFVQRRGRIQIDGQFRPWYTNWEAVTGIPRPALDMSPEGVALRALESLCKTATERALDLDYDQLQDQLLKNADLDDIDYAYLVFGASLNTTDKSARKYIYRFMQSLMQTTSTAGEEEGWYGEYEDVWNQQLQMNEGETYQALPNRPVKTFTVISTNPDSSEYKTTLQWAFISEDTGLGCLQNTETNLEAQSGDIWFNTGANVAVPSQIYFWGNDRFELCWQETSTTWRKLSISGLVFWNHIYSDYSIRIDAYDALVNTKEDGFIIPLHDTILKSLNLVDRTQFASMCGIVVLNCYIEDQKEWYETDAFKITMTVVVIALSILLSYVTGGTSVGLGALAVEALAISGAAAIAASVAINAIVGLLVSQFINFIIQKAIENQQMDTQTGSIISLVLSFIISFASSSGDFSAIFNADTLLSLVTSVAQIAITATAEDLAKQTEEALKATSAKTEDLLKKFEEEFGLGKKLDLELAKKFINELTERPDVFLKRTLMTGSDIVDLTTNVISNFTEYNLRTELL